MQGGMGRPSARDSSSTKKGCSHCTAHSSSARSVRRCQHSKQATAHQLHSNNWKSKSYLFCHVLKLK